MMEFEWDDAKEAANAVKHGATFVTGIKAFADPSRIEIDTSRTLDGEARTKCVGLVEDKLMIVVFTMRGSVRRIISARRANKQEERTYYGNQTHDA